MPIFFVKHRRAAVPAVVAALLFLAGCGESRSRTERIFEMGTPAAVGPLTYNVIDLQWKDALETPAGQRLPRQRFLVLNLSLANSGAGNQSVPLLTLIASDGKEYLEEDRGEGVPQWLGLLRSVAPGQSERGHILFDVPQGAFKLRVTSSGDPETEEIAYINIPFRVDAPSMVGAEAIQGTTQ